MFFWSTSGNCALLSPVQKFVLISAYLGLLNDPLSSPLANKSYGNSGWQAEKREKRKNKPNLMRKEYTAVALSRLDPAGEKRRKVFF